MHPACWTLIRVARTGLTHASVPDMALEEPIVTFWQMGFVLNSPFTFPLHTDEITNSFRRYGHLVVDWPHKAESKSYFPPKGKNSDTRLKLTVLQQHPPELKVSLLNVTDAEIPQLCLTIAIISCLPCTLLCTRPLHCYQFRFFTNGACHPSTTKIPSSGPGVPPVLNIWMFFLYHTQFNSGMTAE